MYQVEEIIDFLKDLSGDNNIKPDMDIFKDIGIVGDDFHEMITKFANRYAVDMKDYLWYFHTDEEGNSGIGGYFFKPPQGQEERITITPAMLTTFANEGKWEITYPKHVLTKKRYDLLINAIVVGGFIIGLIIWLIITFLK